jgi:hypothetical protein
MMSHYGTLVIISKDSIDEDLEEADLEATEISALARQIDIDKHVTRLMSPGEDDWWDWWRGGRWTGQLSGYDPEADPRNIEPCSLCHGSGSRTDAVGLAGEMLTRVCGKTLTWTDKPHPRAGLIGWCNGCDGAGIGFKWPTQWAEHDGDVIPVSALTEEHMKQFHFIVLDGFGMFSAETYIPWAEPLAAKFVRAALPPVAWLQEHFSDGIAVVVRSWPTLRDMRRRTACSR